MDAVSVDLHIANELFIMLVTTLIATNMYSCISNAQLLINYCSLALEK